MAETTEEEQPEPSPLLEPSEWSTSFTPATIPTFIGPPRGPKVTVSSPESPAAFFDLFFSRDLLYSVVTQTNLYYYQSQQNKVINPILPQDHERQWSPLTIVELKAFLGIAIANGLCRNSQITSHWSRTSPLQFTPAIAAAMSQSRFENILRNLHLANNERADPSDTLAKLRGFLERLNENCSRTWNLGREFSIDEMDLAFKGLHKHKERITYKRAGDGFLVYALADRGYTYRFLVKCDNKWDRNIEGLSPTFSAVYNLVSSLPSTSQWHHVYVDNLYSNVRLAQLLYDYKKVLFTSTARENRIPKVCILPPQSAHNAFLGVRKDKIICLTWKDKKIVKFMTTGHASLELVDKERKKATKQSDGTVRRQLVTIPTLNVAYDYNLHMNGVDRADQLRKSYTTKLRSRKWWHVFFWWGLDTAVCNAYIVYCSTTDKPLTHHQFREKLSYELMGTLTSSPTKKRKGSLSLVPVGPSEPPALDHFPCRVPRNDSGKWLERECAQCKKKNERVRSTYECRACGVGLCVDCFRDYHIN